MNIKLHVFDERVYDVIDPYAQLEVIVPDMHLTEGAVWDYENDRLLFNDIPVSNTMSWTEKDGAQVIYNNHNKANGQCFDPQGRLVVCEHASSHLSRCTSDGMNYEVLATHYKGIELFLQQAQEHRRRILAARKRHHIFFRLHRCPPPQRVRRSAWRQRPCARFCGCIRRWKA